MLPASLLGRSDKNSVVLYAACFAAFLLLGLSQASYGPAYERFAAQFGVSTALVASISSAHFGGSALGPVLLAALLTRFSLRTAVMVGSAVFTLGLLGLALAPSWTLALGGALLIGLGFGSISSGFNAAFATLGAGPSNLVNAVFGIGSVAAPLIGLGLGSYPLPFFLFSALALILTLSLRGVRVWPAQAPELAQNRIEKSKVAYFALLFFFYVGIESGLGNWATVQLGRIGNPNPQVITSLYWLALTAGRLIFAVIGSRLSIRTVVQCSAVAALLGCGLIAVPLTAPLGYLAVGLSIAPMFSSLLAWFASRFPVRASPLMLTAGSLGGAALPAFIGLMVAHFGIQAVPAVIAADAAALCVLVWWARRRF